MTAALWYNNRAHKEDIMKRNGMCPVCFLKTVFTRPSKISDLYDKREYDNGVALTPPMGWSSWNTFKNNIDEDLIYQTGVAMKQKGLIDAGYNYINLDDCWHSSMRDENGELQGDLTRFASGMPALVDKLNALGLKVGIYSSNGTLTCEDLPASLGNEYKDAYTFAKWGIEFFKYDFCHNVSIPSYAPTVFGVEITEKGQKNGTFYPCTDAKIEGLAKFMPCKKLSTGCYVSGMDKCLGAMEYSNIYAENDGEYVLTVCCKKLNSDYEKFAEILVNGQDEYYMDFPPQKFWNVTSRTQTTVFLKKGINRIRIFNPIHTRADSAMLQYRKMGKALVRASEKVAEENNAPAKPIVFSICEWGKNQPYKWGALAGNMWRTTPDIRPVWPWIKMIYAHNVKLYKYSHAGAWNDPDMLEVGNGKLTEEQNKSHFALWCMMNAPLVLGNDLRSVGDDVLKIVTNKKLIAINQDRLAKAAKRVKKGSVDILAKPLSQGRVAILVFNKKGGAKNCKVNLEAILKDEYIGVSGIKDAVCEEVYSGKTYAYSPKISVELKKDASEVIVISKR